MALYYGFHLLRDCMCMEICLGEGGQGRVLTLCTKHVGIISMRTGGVIESSKTEELSLETNWLNHSVLLFVPLYFLMLKKLLAT